MKATIAKKEFKERFGQANHFLITALIGIDGIHSGTIKEKPKSFKTSWNPKDIKRSADRTRAFILKSFLGWAVESLEMYLTELNRKPKLLDTETFKSLYSKAGQSVYKKTIFIADEIKVDPILTALMEVLITWRNYTFHYDIDNVIREISMNCLLDKAEEVKTNFSGLEINQLKSTWEKGGDFTFKETASLIKATHDFVSAIDNYVIDNLDYLKYYIDATQKHFAKNKTSNLRYASFDKEKKKKYLRITLQNIAGVTDIDDNTINSIMKEIDKKQLLLTAVSRNGG